MLTLDEMYDILDGLGYGQAAGAVTSINGWKKESLEDVLYWATGYRDFETYLEEEAE